LAFSARQGGGQLAAPLGEAREALVDLLQIPLHGFAVPPARIGAQNKIVRYGHLGEEFTALRHQADSSAYALFRAQNAKILRVIPTLAFRRQKTDQRGEQRRFSGAVWTDHGNDVTGLHFE
jgi:hypothetical protein